SAQTRPLTHDPAGGARMRQLACAPAQRRGGRSNATSPNPGTQPAPLETHHFMHQRGEDASAGVRPRTTPRGT
ncbi:MAG: hypothetical protein ACPGUV_06535, partial [Polyangiales bacterium]